MRRFNSQPPNGTRVAFCRVRQNILHDLVATQHGAHASEQLARAEGLGDVVVGAELETHDAIGFFFLSGHHDDRNRRFPAHLLREIHAVLARETQIEHDRVDRLFREHA